jgi:predicted solute-binding protein
MIHYLLGGLAAFLATGVAGFAWLGWKAYPRELLAYVRQKRLKAGIVPLVLVLITLCALTAVAAFSFVVSIKLIGEAPWPV